MVVVDGRWRYMMDKRNKKRIQKATGIELLNVIDEMDLKKLCEQSLPNHISFLTFEKVEWLNKTLDKFWPSIVEATEKEVKMRLGPMLVAYKPVEISSLTLDKFHLGKTPPKIDGVRIQRFREGQVHMDMEFKWGGSGEIVLNIGFMRTKLPVQLKNLSFFATIRVIFQLSEVIPCISALVVALLPKPKFQIGYKLNVIGGNNANLPGLGDMIEDLVNSTVADQVEWPHRIVVPVGDTPADIMSDLGLKLQGQLKVKVFKAEKLKNKETVGRSDPYVLLFVRVLFKKKTKVIHSNLNPEWMESFLFNVEDTETQTLILQVMDEDIGADKELGIASVPLHDLKPDTEIEITQKLLKSLDTAKVKDKSDRGSITISLKYHPYTKEEQVAAMLAEQNELKAREQMNNGVIGGAMDAVGGGVKMVGSGISAVGSGGSKLVGTGVGAVGSSVGIVGSGVVKASRLVSSGVKRLSSSNRLVSTTSTPVNGSPMHEVNGISKLKEV
ncbi:calcium-dependent lipid-binding protein isoform X2 [Physcomitrium patens]|uniref:calcium-dependent lipid-binding protein isoform X2 n=1 Tax=Physcomitrium patens TaxID=3218 RepID=UPI000D17E170|nr:synaptotagmin-4-like isoform X2 [Physcomitrium patens]|eukprot:XP_024364591.1 synaptotagmin-4-like isoform X2 [Physcomitrella patens]